MSIHGVLPRSWRPTIPPTQRMRKTVRARDLERPPVVLKLKKDRLKVHFPSGWLHDHPLTSAALEDDASYLADAGYELTLHQASA